MLVFIDDSGDPGFKLDRGSSKFFVIAMVIFDDELEAEKTAVAIKEVKRTLRFPDNVEFKFSKSSREVRKKFLHAINPFQFMIRSLVIDKSIIRSQELRSDRDSFYGYAIKTVLKYSDDAVLDAKIRIDGSGDRQFRRSFLSYLRKQLNSKEKKIMRNCKLVDSKENVLVQMADMIAGSIRRSYEKPEDIGHYKEIVKRHVQDEWCFR